MPKVKDLAKLVSVDIDKEEKIRLQIHSVDRRTDGLDIYF